MPEQKPLGGLTPEEEARIEDAAMGATMKAMTLELKALRTALRALARLADWGGAPGEAARCRRMAAHIDNGLTEAAAIDDQADAFEKEFGE
jgi:hypothetical protein